SHTQVSIRLRRTFPCRAGPRRQRRGGNRYRVSDGRHNGQPRAHSRYGAGRIPFADPVWGCDCVHGEEPFFGWRLYRLSSFFQDSGRVEKGGVRSGSRQNWVGPTAGGETMKDGTMLVNQRVGIFTTSLLALTALIVGAGCASAPEPPPMIIYESGRNHVRLVKD